MYLGLKDGKPEERKLILQMLVNGHALKEICMLIPIEYQLLINTLSDLRRWNHVGSNIELCCLAVHDGLAMFTKKNLPPYQSASKKYPKKMCENMLAKRRENSIRHFQLLDGTCLQAGENISGGRPVKMIDGKVYAYTHEEKEI